MRGGRARTSDVGLAIGAERTRQNCKIPSLNQKSKGGERSSIFKTLVYSGATKNREVITSTSIKHMTTRKR